MELKWKHLGFKWKRQCRFDVRVLKFNADKTEALVSEQVLIIPKEQRGTFLLQAGGHNIQMGVNVTTASLDDESSLADDPFPEMPVPAELYGSTERHENPEKTREKRSKGRTKGDGPK